MHAALILAAVSESTDARHLREIGLLVGGLAAVALLVGGILGYMSVRPAKAPTPADPGDSGDAASTVDAPAKPAAAPKPRTAEERIAYIVAGFLLGVSFLIQILAARTA